MLRAAGYPINMQFGGHGIGTTMHQDPHVSNDGRPGRGYQLRPGLLLALEPWIMVDTDELVTDDDGWTLRSATGCLTAHSEHTIAITEDGAEVLTLPSPVLIWLVHRLERRATSASVRGTSALSSLLGHQILPPRSRLSAVTRTDRTMSVSSMTPSATATPSSARNTSGSEPSTRNVAASTMPR